MLPSSSTQIYVADTLGELGLFYRLAPLCCIGRSFSRDGGGGHNPLEAALLNCAVLHGPNVANLLDIYTPMDAAGAAICVESPDKLAVILKELFLNGQVLTIQRQRGFDFAQGQTDVLNKVIMELEPVFLLADLPVLKGLS